MAALNSLPNEILSLISTHLDCPRDLFYLSLASRRLSNFAKLDGWKALLKGRFRLSGLDADARNSVHGLTTLYRNWSRKGFLARYLEPCMRPMSLNSWQPRRWKDVHGQTMGYRPSVDSYEEMYGAWGERREVLAWSAGTQIVMRIKTTGAHASALWEVDQDSGPDPDQPWAFDNFKHVNCWFTYKIPHSSEGRDDITDMKLLRPHQRTMDFEDIVYGTASGQLAWLSLSRDAGRNHGKTVGQQFQTDDQDVRAISLSSSASPMLAATLGHASLALFPISRDHFSEDPIEPLAQLEPAVSDSDNRRFWSCNFLSDNKVAVGLGASYEPIQVFSITPGGFLQEPIRKFSLEYKFQPSSTNYNFDGRLNSTTTIYPILPLSSKARGGSDAGNVFLSGGYDGIVRLHDMRSPRGYENMFWDQTNDSPVYTLATQGLERVVAGVSRHSMIKVFDLRCSGSNAYETIKMPSNRSRTQPQTQNNVDVKSNPSKTKPGASALLGGWNLFLHPRAQPQRNAYRNQYWRANPDSPVYSVSIPSDTSQNLYAGLEGSVQCLTFHGIADAHPDTMLSQSLTHFPNTGAVDIHSSYNAQGDALNLGMYEQEDEDGIGMQLLAQDGVSMGVMKNQQRKDIARVKDLDERWRDIRGDGNRWIRGQQAIPPRRQRSFFRGRGGNRGRGAPRGGGAGRGRGGGDSGASWDVGEGGGTDTHW